MAGAAILMDWLSNVNAAVQNNDGEQLGALYNFHKATPQLKQQLAGASGTDKLRLLSTLTDSALRNSKPWDQISLLQLRALASAEVEHAYVQAFKFQYEAAETFFQLVNTDKESNWWLPALNSFSRTLRFLSYSADAEREAKGEKPKHQVDAQDMIKRYFQRVITDRSDLRVSKKMGCLFLIVHLFKIYFRINNLRLCSNLVAVVNNQNFPKLDVFPIAQTVAFKYYLGRLHIFEENYAKAEQCLDFAFERTARSVPKNKRRILQYLVPVKLLVGKYPLPKLLRKYKLQQFDSLIQAIRSGNLKSFNESLERYQEFFIKKGTFLILEKLKTFVFRNLFRKAYRYGNLDADGQVPAAAAAAAGGGAAAAAAGAGARKTNLLQLSTLQAAVAMNGLQIDADELECIIANLIFSGFIKGYIAHKRCVVLSKQDPFPAAAMANL